MNTLAPPVAAVFGTAPPPPQLGDTLTAIQAFIRKYVVLTDHQVTIVTLWITHTHAIAAADCTPYLQVTSATKRAGKTRLLEVLEVLVARPWLTGRTSAAVLVRKMDAELPTLLLDESDAAFSGEKDYAEALRGILNSGYRRSGKSSLCIGQGANLTYKDFSTFGAKVIAGIGTLPDTIADRALPIQLRRRKSDEPCSRWRQRNGHSEAAPLFKALHAWASQPPILEALRQARPADPAINDDRKIDVLEPLLAIADLAGEAWGTQARAAAVALVGTVEDADIVVELLADIADVLAERDPAGDLLDSKDLTAWLGELEDRPWALWGKHQKPITPHALARLLGPLDIHPGKNRSTRGYRWDAFDDAIARYLPSKVPQRHNANEYGPESPLFKVPHDDRGDALKTADQARIHYVCGAVALQTPNMRDGEDVRPAPNAPTSGPWKGYPPGSAEAAARAEARIKGRGKTA